MIEGAIFMKKGKDILLDVDEVVCFPGFLQAVNDFMETDYVIDDFQDYYIDEAAIPKERFSEFNEFINQRNLYENAQILPHAIETIKKLNEIYHIYFYSSCVNPLNIQGSGRIFQDKYNFLLSNIPFIDPKHYIFTSAKHMFRADIQIDDRIFNLDKNVETKILFPSYHNKNITEVELKEKGALRAGYDWKEGWNEVEKLLLKEETSLSDSQPKIYILARKNV